MPVNSLQIRILFEGAIVNDFVAKWADSGDQGLAVVHLPDTATELQKRILFSNPNAGSVRITSVNFTTASTKVADCVVVGAPVLIGANAVDVNVAIKITFANPVALDQIDGVVDLIVESVV